MAATALLSPGFGPWAVPSPDACCVVLVPLSQDGSSAAIVHAVKGRAIVELRQIPLW